VNDALIRRVLTPRGGAAGCVALVVRVVAGSLFIAFGIGKFADHMKEAIDFQSYGVPLPDVAVYVSGTIEAACGALLVLGLFTRLGATLLAVNLVVALSTAGVMEGGTFHLGVGPAMLVAMLFLLWAGGGALSMDGRFTTGAGPPAVT
jgi:uncharacterized membrane protein YphA (DoxX/SURF4 family)